MRPNRLHAARLPPPVGLSYRGWMVLLLGFGAAIRLVLASQTDGVAFDLESFTLTGDALRHSGFDAYSAVNAGEFPRWPYPPGYFGWILAAGGIGDLTGVSLFTLYRLPPIAADLAIAWLVQEFLRARGASEQTRLGAVALVALGPSFIAISGYHGQIDSIAILPAVAALVVWERGGDDRALWAGVLVGAGGALKTVPLLLLLALLPASRSRREALTVAACAVAVPLLLVLPFALADREGVELLYHYRGAIGLGGIGLVVQPDLPLGWFGLAAAEPDGLASALRDNGGPITVIALALTGAFLYRVRAPAVLGAVLIWLAVYVFGVNFFLQYLVWGLPFFLLAGYLRQVAALEALLLAPTLVNYIGPGSEWQAWALYTVPMTLVWVSFAAAFLVVARRLAAERPRSRTVAAAA